MSLVVLVNHLSLAFFVLCRIEVNVLLLNKLLKFVDLLAIKVDAHLVCCCD